MVPVSDSQVDLTNNFFVVPKSGGRWYLIIDLNHYLSPSHFKMERLYMLPNAVHLDIFMAKVELKDAYLTIPSVGKVSLYLGLSKQRRTVSAIPDPSIWTLLHSISWCKDIKVSASNVVRWLI